MSEMTLSKLSSTWTGPNRLNRHLRERMCIEAHIPIDNACESITAMHKNIQNRLLDAFNQQQPMQGNNNLVQTDFQTDLWEVETTTKFQKPFESVFDDGFNGSRNGQIN